MQVDVPAAARDKNERLPALEGALLRHGIFVQTASFLFVSEAFDEKVVAEAARRWERAVSEVYGAGLSTTVFPIASAGAIFHASMSSGKFHGITWPITPTGAYPAISFSHSCAQPAWW